MWPPPLAPRCTRLLVMCQTGIVGNGLALSCQHVQPAVCLLKTIHRLLLF
jgi:hypothetical protein